MEKNNKGIVAGVAHEQAEKGEKTPQLSFEADSE